MESTSTGTTWQQTACILCSVNCGIEVQLDGRRIARVRGDRAHPGSQGYTCEKAQRLDHYQNGRDRLHDAAAPARRRHASRRSTGTPRSARSPRGSAAIRDAHGGDDDLLLRRRRPGEPSRRRLRRAPPARALGSIYTLERARAGEDRRVLGRRPALRPAALPHHRRLRARRGRGVRRQEPVAVARLPARPRDPARDRRRPGPRADRHRPAPHRDRRARRHPPAGAPGHRRLLPRARCSPCSSQEDLRRPRRSSREHTANGDDDASRRCAPSPIADYCARAGVAEDAACARSRAASPRADERLDLRGPRHPAGAAQHAQLLPREARSTCSPATSRKPRRR